MRILIVLLLLNTIFTEEENKPLPLPLPGLELDPQEKFLNTPQNVDILYITPNGPVMLRVRMTPLEHQKLIEKYPNGVPSQEIKELMQEVEDNNGRNVI